MKEIITALILITFLTTAPCYAERDLITPGSLADLTYLTEEYYPYNYSEDDKLKGISVDLLHMIWDDLGISYQPVTAMPWARAYERLKQDRNTVLFSTARVPNRENLFLWAGPVVVARFVLIAKKSKGIRINSLKELKGYRVGTLRDDISDIFLKRHRDIAKIDSVACMEMNVEKLVQDRLDMIAYEQGSWRRLVVRCKLNPDDFEVVHTLNEASIYYAFHLETPEHLVKQFQDGLDRIKATPAYEELLDAYLK